MPSAADPPNDRKRIQAVQTTLDIIDTLRERGIAGVTEIATEIGVSKGTVYNHLVTLEENDYVVKDEDDRYHLGLRFIDVSHQATSRVPILELAKTEVDKLAEKSDEMALFTVEEHGMGVCLYVAYGDQAVQTPLYVGHRSELHHTAVGKAILAHLPRERVEAIIDQRGLTKQTEHTITDRETLFEQLEEVRKRGLAFNEQETIHGLVGVGAPIKDQDGSVLGALSIIGPSSRLDEERFQRELPDMIMRSVNIIEINSTSL
ncbi:IclR family transcriptional regulator [Halobacteria archaeon AArc-m2/3/4]|uniref:IclR family transcriptional regulator n=1 Tax=Natronoglomus mannanivorans TaxID=2979990 RepID=A0AAP3E2U3_9EURY|nr:IclR family transcriptional regulator [Halobacteria archaeon AArc-xg1-1]MCU4973824.1 IclR family transcriptional regulator [Halobacteria archaeon AArc-m2/3/4]